MNEQNINDISGVSKSPDKETDFSILPYENSIKNKKYEENKTEKQKKGFGKSTNISHYNFNNKYIKIGTHNVQGFNKESKQMNL